MIFKSDDRPQLSFQNIKIGDLIKARLIGVSVLPNSFLGLFYTELGHTKVFIGNPSNLKLKDVLEYKGKDCWLKYKGHNLKEDLSYTYFDIIWI